MASWTNPSGGNWSASFNWVNAQLPGYGDTVTFAVGYMSSASIIDSGFTTSVLGDIDLQIDNILDVQRSVSVTALNNASSNGSGNDGGVVEVGNGATLTLNGDLVNQALYIGGDGTAAKGTFVVAGMLQGGGLLTLDGVNFDVTTGIDDPTGQFPTLMLENGATYTASAGEFFDAGTIELAGGGTANFGAMGAGALVDFYGSFAGQVVAMSGSHNELVLPNTDDGLSLAVSGFAETDRLEIAGISSVKSASYDASQGLTFFSGVNGTGTVLAALSNVTLQAGLPSTLGADHFTIGSDSSGTYVEFTSCFAPGTHILTVNGEILVEELQEGDQVLCPVKGKMVPKPIIWIGRRQLDLTRHPYPWMASPIRVLRGAFAENVPCRDLVLSPDHCILVDGCLVPTKMLVNGSTIVRERWASITYFHVECESHSIIMAEGLTVETYLDTGNRATYENAGLALVLHPEFAVNVAAKSWKYDACAPLTVDPATVRPIWRGLRERADHLGFECPPSSPSTLDPALRLIANGRRLRALAVREGRHIFGLPPGVKEITLTSRTFCPGEESPWLGDERQLGVALREIVLIRGAERQVLSPDNPVLHRGWWPVESDGSNLWRWTNGSGVVSLLEPVQMVEIATAMEAAYPVDTHEPALLQAA